jgi:drug/metabolite transporter (DMT)-like permease
LPAPALLDRLAAESRPTALFRRDSPLLGIGLVLLSTVFLASSDTAAKYLSGSLPAIQIAWMRWLGFLVIMSSMVLARGPGKALHTRRPSLQILRGAGLVGSALTFILSLRFLPIADATAITFVAPIFITALSIPFLGETVGRRRWIAAMVGLVGVLVIVRPGATAFHPAALLPILTALFWAGTIIVTRKMSDSEDALTTMAYSALIGFVLLSALLPWNWAQPDWREIALGGFIGLAATVGHWIVVVAYRYAGASVLAPFSYSQLVWASSLGYLVFGSIPDLWTFVGAGVIIASGLYTVHRERVNARARAAALTLTGAAAAPARR